VRAVGDGGRVPDTPNGEAESVSSDWPSTRNSTLVIEASFALASIGVVPLTVAPDAGLVSVTSGGAAVLTRISCVLSGPALPALSKARYLTVVVASTVNSKGLV
jgi:hypothetical protein